RSVGERHHVRAWKIAAAEIHVPVHAVGENENLLAVHAERLEQAEHLRRLGRIVVEAIDHEQRIFGSARIQRALAGQNLDLLVRAHRVIARRRTEDRATTDPVRSARGTLTGTTGALLLPRLLITTGNEAARLGRRGTLTLVGEIRLDRV